MSCPITRARLVHVSFTRLISEALSIYFITQRIVVPQPIIMIIIALFILGLKTSNNLQQFKYKNDIKQYFTEIIKN